MTGLPLAHVSWAVATNTERQAVDAFLMDVFGAQSVFEMLMADLAGSGFDREERLMVIGDTMLIPIAPAGPGENEGSPIGGMLRKNAAPGRWLGVSLRCADLKATAQWFTARGFKLHFDPGMEDHYFLIGPRQVMGMRIEVMQGELPNDPRLKPDWAPTRWRDDHPLGIEGLQSIAVSAVNAASARELFADQLGWPELATRRLPSENATAIGFDMGDAVIEALIPDSPLGPLAKHQREVTGIYGLTFKIRSAVAAATYLRGKGFELVGAKGGRFAIVPGQAHGRLIWLTEREVVGYPPPRSTLRTPGVLAA